MSPFLPLAEKRNLFHICCITREFETKFQKMQATQITGNPLLNVYGLLEAVLVLVWFIIRMSKTRCIRYLKFGYFKALNLRSVSVLLFLMSNLFWIVSMIAFSREGYTSGGYRILPDSNDSWSKIGIIFQVLMQNSLISVMYLSLALYVPFFKEMLLDTFEITDLISKREHRLTVIYGMLRLTVYPFILCACWTRLQIALYVINYIFIFEMLVVAMCMLVLKIRASVKHHETLSAHLTVARNLQFLEPLYRYGKNSLLSASFASILHISAKFYVLLLTFTNSAVLKSRLSVDIGTSFEQISLCLIFIMVAQILLPERSFHITADEQDAKEFRGYEGIFWKPEILNVEAVEDPFIRSAANTVKKSKSQGHLPGNMKVNVISNGSPGGTLSGISHFLGKGKKTDWYEAKAETVVDLPSAQPNRPPAHVEQIYTEITL